MRVYLLVFYQSTDMSKAFDSVQSPLLLSKLKSYGFNDNVIKMLNSYLSDRYNRVRMGSTVTSDWKRVVRGCPQGSSLGPLIWNIFQNDLVYNIDANISMYADDHQICQKGKGIDSVHTMLEKSASSATEWASDTRRLERIQERGLRAVYRDTKSSYNQLLNRANLPTLLNRRLQDICILMYKVQHTKMCSEAITNMFKPRDSCYRNSDFLIPRFNTVTFGKHSLRYLGPILWRKLDKKDRLSKSLGDFKNGIRKKNLTSLIDNGCRGCFLCNS
ncbi:uncharacterized protein LOC116293242 [Actinia tenebrosa]|uniref:Uncharacterized protein LOC116293242 n=1 Tax=Actinia tenebrosa TaxID=6105 RepID=A0A6P8HNC2_ACTTE|nr:uncharacterized protein LOC116293242 [Actinia tenebrosa]